MRLIPSLTTFIGHDFSLFFFVLFFPSPQQKPPVDSISLFKVMATGSVSGAPRFTRRKSRFISIVDTIALALHPFRAPRQDAPLSPSASSI
jgi:hypothetical protein